MRPSYALPWTKQSDMVELYTRALLVHQDIARIRFVGQPLGRRSCLFSSLQGLDNHCGTYGPDRSYEYWLRPELSGVAPVWRSDHLVHNHIT